MQTSLYTLIALFLSYGLICLSVIFIFLCNGKCHYCKKLKMYI